MPRCGVSNLRFSNITIRKDKIFGCLFYVEAMMMMMMMMVMVMMVMAMMVMVMIMVIS